MQRPALIPHHLKETFHNKKSCIDVRHNKVHALKANTNNRTWKNIVNTRRAIIAMNTRTDFHNNLLISSDAPFHLVTFGCGADTYYWGRYKYKCISEYEGSPSFILTYVDTGYLNMCMDTNCTNMRSKLEERWKDAFQVSDTRHAYEPATLKLSNDKEYTPDFWLPQTSTFIEIKGPPPTETELNKCKLASQLGFRIKMFHGGPDGFDCYEWPHDGSFQVRRHASWYRYLHPKPNRKRRRLHNVQRL